MSENTTPEPQSMTSDPGPGPDAYPEGEPVPYALTARAEAVLASWDRYRQAEREAEAGQ
jgi:hypothetical protein